MCQICENQGKTFEFITNVDEDVNLVSHSNCNFTLTRFLNLYSRRVRWNRVSINLDRNVLSWKRSVKKSRIRANNIDNFASRKIIHDELSAEDEMHPSLSLSLSLSLPPFFSFFLLSSSFPIIWPILVKSQGESRKNITIAYPVDQR